MKEDKNRSGGAFLVNIAMFLGFFFLYMPIVVLVFFAFNASSLVGVWGGASTKWFAVLAHDDIILSAAWLTIQVALFSASLGCVLGTLSGYVLATFARFRGKTFFSGLVSAPLVMPEVVTGLSLLLLFVALAQLTGWPSQRNILTLALAHTTFTMAYATVVMQARFSQLDKSIEEAAMNLGATPLKVFFVITLPTVAPSLVSGWLLSFTLSLDTLVISSFVAGPGATTLPMVIFSKIRFGLTPEINALASVILLFGIVTALLTQLLSRSASRSG